MVRVRQIDLSSRAVDLELNFTKQQRGGKQPRISDVVGTSRKPSDRQDYLRRPEQTRGILPRLNLVSGGLVPVGDTGLWITPGEPADPRDCERYPSSLFCGGNPFSLRPISLTPSIAVDQCNIGIRFDGVFGFVRIPPVSLVYRFPGECRTRETPTQNLPKNEVYQERVKIPEHNCFDSPNIVAVYQSYLYSYEQGVFYDETEPYEAESTTTAEIVSIEFPYTGDQTFYDIYTSTRERAKAKVSIKYKNIFTYNQRWKEAYRSNVPDNPDGKYEFISETTLDTYVASHEGYVHLSSFNTFFGGAVWVNGLGEALNRLQFDRQYTNYRYAYDSGDQGYGSYKVEVDELVWDVKIECGSRPQIVPPPPPLPKRLCCMGCCPKINTNDELLRSLLIKVNKLSEVVGVDEYPASLPSSLISKDKGFLGNLIPNPKVEIKSLTRLFSWYIERFDELVGQFEIPIEVKDADPTTPGEQPVGMKIPNIAEAIAEILGLLLQSTINTETLVNMGTRTLLATGQDLQQNYKSYMALQTIIDYLGYKTKDTHASMPLVFTPGKDNLDEILKECKQDISVPEYDEKTNFRTSLLKLEQAAAIIQAVHVRKIDKKGDIKQQIIDTIKAASLLNDKLSEDKKDENGKTDFDKFIDDVEIGFTNHTGITDSQHPYGDSYDSRPRIKKIGNQSET